MKIERLSENSIRCTLNRADLDSRELKISELAYGTEKAKSLFKDMIAQASFECGFEAEDIPLDIKVAVMGCVVNGPGEAKEADLGVAGGIGEGLIIKHGRVFKKVPEEELLPALRYELEHWSETNVETI